MNYYFIELCQAHENATWGLQIVDWVRLPPMRVWKNRLGKSAWFWMSGREIMPEELVRLRKGYPIARYMADRP